MTTESVISEDQLAIDWTLTEQDMDFVTSNSRGGNQHLKLAAQLCYLRRYGVFILDSAVFSLGKSDLEGSDC